MLAEAFPHLADKIIGGNYEGLPKWRSAASTLASFGAWGVLLAIFLGIDRICELTGVSKENVPQTVQQLFENKGTAIVGFMMLNMLSTQLISTGAFEVYLMDASTGRTKQVWSTLENGGRIPNPVMLATMLRDTGLIMAPSFEARIAGGAGQPGIAGGR